MPGKITVPRLESTSVYRYRTVTYERSTVRIVPGDAVVPVNDMDWESFCKHLAYRHHVDTRTFNAGVAGFTEEQVDKLSDLYERYHATIHRLNFAMQSHVHTREVA